MRICHVLFFLASFILSVHLKEFCFVSKFYAQILLDFWPKFVWSVPYNEQNLLTWKWVAFIYLSSKKVQKEIFLPYVECAAPSNFWLFRLEHVSGVVQYDVECVYFFWTHTWQNVSYKSFTQSFPFKKLLQCYWLLKMILIYSTHKPMECSRIISSMQWQRMIILFLFS